jgi:hypothetical protein
MRAKPGKAPMRLHWAEKRAIMVKVEVRLPLDTLLVKPGKAPMRLHWAEKRATMVKVEVRLPLDTLLVKPVRPQTPLWSMHKGPP